VDVGASVLFNAPPAVPRLLQHFYAPWRTFNPFPARRDTVERARSRLVRHHGSNVVDLLYLLGVVGLVALTVALVRGCAALEKRR
jgi:hypothetical protein